MRGRARPATRLRTTGVGQLQTVKGGFGQSLLLGRCGHRGCEPPTAAMGRSAVVGAEFGSNGRL